MLNAEHRCCIYDCNHPLYGDSGGICLADADGEAFCHCNEGYVIYNDFEEPSCVPEGLWLPICRCILVINSIVVAQSAFRFIKLYYDVPRKNNGAPGSIVGWQGLRLTKSNKIMFWLYFNSGVCCLTHASLASTFPLGKLYGVWVMGAFPAGMVACLTTCQLWLQSLPLQLLPPGTLAFTFKRLVDNINVIKALELSLLVYSIIPAVLVVTAPAPPRWVTFLMLNVAAELCCVTCTTAAMVMGITLYRQLSSLVVKNEEQRKKNKAIKKKIVISLIIAGQILIGAFTAFVLLDATALGRGTSVAVRGSYGVFPALWFSFNQEVMKYSKSKSLESGPTAIASQASQTPKRIWSSQSPANPRGSKVIPV
ncbi:unnamed protein product [Chrysoparadoxa australica]